MKKDKALELALEWFKCYADKSMSRNNAEALADEVVDAIKEALAQPEQEPVAWIYRSTGALFDICPNDADENEFVPLYTTPPQRKPLNWEPIQEFWRNNSNIDWDELESAIKQAAHGIKENT